MAGRSVPLDTHERTSLKLLPAHGRRPVYISQRIIPNAKMSIFSEQGSFLKASGAMYRGVPAKFDRVFTNCPIFSAARPKSQSFRRLEPSNMRFSGLTSRWTTPHKCKNCGKVKIALEFENIIEREKIHIAHLESISDFHRKA
jgi:hypothetical protein